MGHFALTVGCRSNGPHEDGRFGCDGWFCTCWCHVPRKWDELERLGILWLQTTLF